MDTPISPPIPPIDASQRKEVVDQTHHYIDLAASLLDRDFSPIPVLFDLSGKCAGMYRVSNQKKVIRYNPYIFVKYYEDSLDNTVPHEVAHYISDCVYGRRRIKPHGPQWKSIMRAFGKPPTVTSRYDLTGIPTRQYQRLPYHCACQSFELTIHRHKKIQNRQRQYFCRQCKAELVFGELPDVA